MLARLFTMTKPNRAPRRPRTPRSRRGTIIVLALGVLAILAVAAVSYVAIVRLDRDAAIASRTEVNVQQQVDTVVSEIGSLLAADLFGNKIVARDTPSANWPGAFEDAEFNDRPRVYGNWAINPTNANAWPVINLDGTAPTTIAPSDDAWLASTQPVFDQTDFANAYWPQITNLRSAYRYAPRAGSSPNRWLRDDGRYADLLQWFLNPTTQGNANPGADLTAGGAFPARFGSAFYDAGGADPFDNRAATQVFGFQMNRVEDATTPINTIANHQERRWVDTDGDLRPDARWQQLDSLGNAFGLSWVVAARIIDASSLVNYNTATLAPSTSFAVADGLIAGRAWPDIVARGDTPADVDLLRLVGYAAANSSATRFSETFNAELQGAGTIWPVGLFTDRLLDRNGSPAYREMLALTQGFGPTVRKLGENPPASTNDPLYNPPYDRRLNRAEFPKQDYPTGAESTTLGWGNFDVPTALQRSAWYEQVSSDERNPAPSSLSLLPVRDAIDLWAFRAVNNPVITSRVEQFLDGTEQNGYLPGTTGTTYGPLRSREGVSLSFGGTGNAARALGDPDFTAPTPGLPTLPQIRWDNRHLLTPVSGIGRISPVPVINTAAPNEAQRSYFDGQRSITRPNLPELNERARSAGLGSADAQRIFDSLVWALAPLATDLPLSNLAGVNNLYNNANGANDSQNRHYGGTQTNDGPASMLGTITGVGDPGSSYAVLKALCLTANLIDVLDSPANPAFGNAISLENESATALRFFSDPTKELPNTTDNPNMALAGVKVLGARLPQGDIPSSDTRVLRKEIFGGSSATHGSSVSVFGLDRPPYLVQASHYAFYEDSASVPSGQQVPTIDPNDPNDQSGSVFAFELRNPWPQTIDAQNYSVELRNPANNRFIRFDLNAATGSKFISPGGSAVFAYGRQPLASAPTEIRDYWLNASGIFPAQITSLISNAPGVAPTAFLADDTGFEAFTDDGTTVTPEAMSSLTPVMANWLLDAGGSPTPTDQISIVLIRKANNTGGVNFDTVVDRLSPPAGTGRFFPDVLTANYTVSFDVIPAGGPNGENLDPVGRLRLAVASTVNRPTNSGATTGFPAYVAERREANALQSLPYPATGALIPNGGFLTTEQRRQVWRVGSVGFPGLPSDPEPTPAQMVLSAEGIYGPGTDPAWHSIGTLDKGRFKVNGTDIVLNLQLFNPTPFSVTNPPSEELGPVLRSAGDLLMVPAVATIYIHPSVADNKPEVRDAVMTRAYNGDTRQVTFARNLSSGEGAWVTAAEMLGSDWELFRTTAAVGTSPANPYAGVLDPTRFIPTQTLNTANLPDELSIPLALRVVDAFDGLKTRGDLAPGTINLNTAPGRVLATVPFLSPLEAVQNSADNTAGAVTTALPDPTSVGAANNPQAYPLLGNWLLPYRSLGLGFGGTPTFARVNRTNIDGLRTRPGAAKDFGLVSPAELAIMGTWAPANAGNPDPSGINNILNSGFLFPGANSALEKGLPFGARGEPAKQVLDDGTVNHRRTDGPEERAAILRSIANIVTTRSDVYAAWFVLRGYDPDVIESINVTTPGGPVDLATARNAMNNPKFQPTVDTRWLVLFDRSNVKSPTDRPKVLLKVELPSNRP